MNSISFPAGMGGLAVLLAACSAPTSTTEIAEAESLESQDEALSPNALTRAQSATVLKLIDDICGDTWCEGDYNFDFRALTCDSRRMTCTLRFQMFPWDTVASGSSAYSRSCETTGFSGFDSLVATAPNGYQSLVPSFYDALTTCIGKLEVGSR
jgi:hypothetical protein